MKRNSLLVGDEAARLAGIEILHFSRRPRDPAEVGRLLSAVIDMLCQRLDINTEGKGCHAPLAGRNVRELQAWRTGAEFFSHYAPCTLPCLIMALQNGRGAIMKTRDRNGGTLRIRLNETALHLVARHIPADALSAPDHRNALLRLMLRQSADSAGVHQVAAIMDGLAHNPHMDAELAIELLGIRLPHAQAWASEAVATHAATTERRSGVACALQRGCFRGLARNPAIISLPDEIIAKIAWPRGQDNPAHLSGEILRTIRRIPPGKASDGDQQDARAMLWKGSTHALRRMESLSGDNLSADDLVLAVAMMQTLDPRRDNQGLSLQLHQVLANSTSGRVTSEESLLGTLCTSDMMRILQPIDLTQAMQMRRHALRSGMEPEAVARKLVYLFALAPIYADTAVRIVEDNLLSSNTLDEAHLIAAIGNPSTRGMFPSDIERLLTEAGARVRSNLLATAHGHHQAVEMAAFGNNKVMAMLLVKEGRRADGLDLIAHRIKNSVAMTDSWQRNPYLNDSNARQAPSISWLAEVASGQKQCPPSELLRTIAKNEAYFLREGAAEHLSYLAGVSDTLGHGNALPQIYPTNHNPKLAWGSAEEQLCVENERLRA